MKFLTRIWFKKIIRDIARQKLLTLALIMLCFFGTGSYLALTMGYQNLYSSYQRIYQQTNFADAEISTLNDNWFNITQIKDMMNGFTTNHTEIQAINCRLIVDTGYNITSSINGPTRQFLAGGRAIGIKGTQSTEHRINDLIFTSGSYQNLFSRDNSVLLEAHFSQKFEINKGDVLSTEIFDKHFDFVVQGVVFSPEYLVVIPSKHDFLPTSVFGIIYLPIERLQDYSNLTGLANNLIVKMAPNVETTTRDKIINELTELLEVSSDVSFAEPVMQERQISNLALRLDLETFEEIALILPIIVLGVASISIYITLGRTVQNQKRNIGIASCLGYFPNDILLHYICFVLLIGGLGSVLGVGFGIITSGLVTWVYSFFMRFPQIIVIQIQFHLVIIALVAGLGVSFLSGAIPAWRASRMIPREALQTTISVEKGSRTLLEKIIFTNPFGLRLTIPIRNLFRKRMRTIATISAIAAAVMILTVSFAFIDSVTAGVNRQFNETSQYDLIIKYEGYKFHDLGVKDDIAYIQNLPGVISIDPVLQIPSTIRNGNNKQEVLITAWNTTTPAAHKFQWSSSQDTLQNESVVVCSALAQQYNIQVGSEVFYEYPYFPLIHRFYNFIFDEIWSNASDLYGPEYAKNLTLEYLKNLVNQNRESLSFSNNVNDIDFLETQIYVSGISKEIWGSIVYTTVHTITRKMGIDVFKTELGIDLTPSSQLILRVSQPSNITLLEEIRNSITHLEGIRSIQFNYDFQHSVDILMAAFNAVILVFLVFACLLAGAAIFTTIYVNFQERKREIATMMTVGLSDREFLLIMTLENLCQAFLGIFLGIPIGNWIASWILDNALRLFYFEIIIQPLTWLMIWVGVITVVLISELPAFYNGIKLDLTVVTKELSS